MKNYEYYYLAKLNTLVNAKDRTRIKGTLKPGDRVHISAVCGKVMASIACILKDYGYEVTGSDKEFFAPMSDVLKNHGIKCSEYSVKNLDGVDLVVVGNTLSPDAVEVVEAKNRKIPMMSSSEVLGQIFKDKRSLVVAGTHGKTTTSALLAHTFLYCQKNPAYMIGGVFQNGNDSYSVGDEHSKFVVYEGDEYNCAFFDRGPKFLLYNSSSVILTSVEHDHVDLYPTFEDYKQAFVFLVEAIPKDGYLVVNESVLENIDLSNYMGKVFTYGSSKDSDVSYEIEKTDSNGTYFSIFSNKIGNISGLFIPMFGEYNVANATAVYTLSILEKLSQEEVIKALEKFPGTKERQEVLGIKTDGTIVIRDYAHHPTAVSLTLKGLRLGYPDRRFVTIFEPRSASSKRKVFQNDYVKSLSVSDVSIVICPQNILAGTEDVIDVNMVKEGIVSSGKYAYSVTTHDEALNTLKKISKPGDLVVFMSSGDMDKIPFSFLES